MPNLTAKLARHIVGYRSAGLDRAALTVAKQCVLDWYGVTLAGSNEPVARILREEIATSAQGPSSIAGFNLRCSPVDAALINGATSHALDYDDVHPLIGHPTAAVLPAVLSIAEAKGRSGMDVLRAFIAGYEAAGFVGSLVMRSHYERGFHSTATVGSFGAAAAAGLLLDLDEAQMAVAFGLAGTQAAGLKSMFGTMAKPFHAGRAAANGVLAARLAARGFTANPGVLEVAQGFVATQSDSERRSMCHCRVRAAWSWRRSSNITQPAISPIPASRRSSCCAGSCLLAAPMWQASTSMSRRGIYRFATLPHREAGSKPSSAYATPPHLRLAARIRLRSRLIRMRTHMIRRSPWFANG